MNVWVKIIIWVILLSIILRLTSEKFAKRTARIHKNGFQVLDCLNEGDINYLKSHWEAGESTEKIKRYLHTNQKVLEHIQKLLGPHYVFQDYILMIEKSKIHTCHRDNNSKLLNPKQKHHSYTIIFYLDDMERCLDVIDKSNKSSNGLFLTDPTVSVRCKPGNAILFDASLIHSGSFNIRPNNKRIQMKLTHVEDLEAIDFFQNYNKTIDKDNTIPEVVTVAQKHLTCQVPILSDIVNNSTDFPLSETFSKFFYGDSGFYDLKDV